MEDPSGPLTPAAYTQAEQLIAGHLSQRLLHDCVKVQRIPGSDRFWYRRKAREGIRYVIVDPETGCQSEAFDHSAVAKAVGTITRFPVTAAALPFSRLDFHTPGRIGIHLSGMRLLWDAGTSQLQQDPHGGIAPSESASPDGRWAVSAQAHNLFLRDLTTGDRRQLTEDGTAERSWGGHTYVPVVMKRPGQPGPAPVVVWAPDSRTFAVALLRTEGVAEQAVTISGAGGRAQVHSAPYPIPGDARLPVCDYFLVDVASGRVTASGIDDQACVYFNPLAIGWSSFSADGTSWHVVTADRHYRHGELNRVDVATGKRTVLVREETDTHLDFGPTLLQTNVRCEGGEVLWWSQRSGWGHLYRYDANGVCRNAVTQGDWLVTEILALDPAAGWVWFSAAGREPGDPYRRHLYRARLDGSSMERLDQEDAHHTLTATGNGRWFVDTISTLQDFGRTVLRDRDGRVVLELEVADASALPSTGFRAPERLALKAADGETDIWATVILPREVEAGRQYPLLDDIYPGPQVNRCFAGFGESLALMLMDDAFALASLGFVVVQLDGRGTPGRSKAFRDHSYGRLSRASDLDDHEAAIRQLADRYPIDLERVGIYGGSGGGYASTRAVLTRPKFFKAAVSSAGNHDLTGYFSVWSDKWMGPDAAAKLAEESNPKHAAGCEGRLLLIHGELDDNVHPAQTLRVVDQLIQANVDFELLIVPGCGHVFMGRIGYVTRRKWDFFVRHLLGREPPRGVRLAEPPVDFARLA